MPLITPDQLEADAVLPQCLDNQYVSDRLFTYLVDHSVDYDDAEVRKIREEETKTEFMRSLVYSSQVVINRVYMKSNEYLYKNYLPENRDNFMAFAQLLRDKAIVPFLFTESELAGASDIPVSNQGEAALRAVATEAGDVTCARLAIEDGANEQRKKEMESRFGGGLFRLQSLDSQRRRAMAAELFSDPDKLQDTEVWQSFDRALDNLALYAFTKAGELRAKNLPAFNRTHVYGDQFVVPSAGANVGQAVILGRFRKPGRNAPHLLELKKFVDLVYNTNLPDLLHRYSFTPVGLPTRIALQDDPTVESRHIDLQNLLTDPAILEFIQQTFMAHSQKAMSLPFLSDLTVADVVKIRRDIPEWGPFKESQKKILSDPTHFANHLQEFQENFDNFQRELSKWYNTHYEQRRTEEKYANVVSLVIRVAGKALVLGLGKEHPYLDAAIAGASEWIPNKVKGYAARLMVGVYDIGQKKLDKQRSYSIELMRTSEELTRKDVEDMIAQAVQKGRAAQSGSEADQGKQ